VCGFPQGLAVLLLHGLSGARDTWAETVGRLQDRFQVWTIDFRGHGHSDRADRYLIADYVSDAEAALAVIGRPAVVVGHSLGAVTAGALAQRPHPLVRAVFLEDPPWYLGQAAEWDKGLYKQIFPLLRAQQDELQQAGAPLSQWLEAASSAPSPKGGVAADHIGERHLLSSASARSRHDVAAWDPSIDLTLLAEFHNTPGFCDEYSYCYLATDCSPTEADRHGVEEQAMTIEHVRLDAVPELIAAGELVDGKSIIGLLLAREHLR